MRKKHILKLSISAIFLLTVAVFFSPQSAYSKDMSVRFGIGSSTKKSTPKAKKTCQQMGYDGDFDVCVKACKSKGFYCMRDGRTDDFDTPCWKCIDHQNFCKKDADCDDGLFCNGPEVCEKWRCYSKGNPCLPNETCNEDIDKCESSSECTNNGQCDDGNFCNGVEACMGGECTSIGNPCNAGKCSEEKKACMLGEDGKTKVPEKSVFVGGGDETGKPDAYLEEYRGVNFALQKRFVTSGGLGIGSDLSLFDAFESLNIDHDFQFGFQYRSRSGSLADDIDLTSKGPCVPREKCECCLEYVKKAKEMIKGYEQRREYVSTKGYWSFKHASPPKHIIEEMNYQKKKHFETMHRKDLDEAYREQYGKKPYMWRVNRIGRYKSDFQKETREFRKVVKEWIDHNTKLGDHLKNALKICPCIQQSDDCCSQWKCTRTLAYQAKTLDRNNENLRKILKIVDSIEKQVLPNFENPDKYPDLIKEEVEIERLFLITWWIGKRSVNNALDKLAECCKGKVCPKDSATSVPEPKEKTSVDHHSVIDDLDLQPYGFPAKDKKTCAQLKKGDSYSGCQSSCKAACTKTGTKDERGTPCWTCNEKTLTKEDKSFIQLAEKLNKESKGSEDALEEDEPADTTIQQLLENIVVEPDYLTGIPVDLESPFPPARPCIPRDPCPCCFDMVNSLGRLIDTYNEWNEDPFTEALYFSYTGWRVGDVNREKERAFNKMHDTSRSDYARDRSRAHYNDTIRILYNIQRWFRRDVGEITDSINRTYQLLDAILAAMNNYVHNCECAESVNQCCQEKNYGNCTSWLENEITRRVSELKEELDGVRADLADFVAQAEAGWNSTSGHPTEEQKEAIQERLRRFSWSDLNRNVVDKIGECCGGKACPKDQPATFVPPEDSVTDFLSDDPVFGQDGINFTTDASFTAPGIDVTTNIDIPVGTDVVFDSDDVDVIDHSGKGSVIKNRDNSYFIKAGEKNMIQVIPASLGTGTYDAYIDFGPVKQSVLAESPLNSLGETCRTDNDCQVDTSCLDFSCNEDFGCISQTIPDSSCDGIVDFGAEIGGPIIKDKLWVWGSYGRDKVNDVPIANQPETDSLINFAAKVNGQIGNDNEASMFFHYGDKIKTGRNAGSTRPQDTTWAQRGPSPIYKVEDQQIFGSDTVIAGRFASEGGYFEVRSPETGKIPAQTSRQRGEDQSQTGDLSFYESATDTAKYRLGRQVIDFYPQGTQSGSIFSDGFESGDVSAWSSPSNATPRTSQPTVAPGYGIGSGLTVLPGEDSKLEMKDEFCDEEMDAYAYPDCLGDCPPNQCVRAGTALLFGLGPVTCYYCTDAPVDNRPVIRLPDGRIMRVNTIERTFVIVIIETPIGRVILRKNKNDGPEALNFKPESIMALANVNSGQKLLQQIAKNMPDQLKSIADLAKELKDEFVVNKNRFDQNGFGGLNAIEILRQVPDQGAYGGEDVKDLTASGSMVAAGKLNGEEALGFYSAGGTLAYLVTKDELKKRPDHIEEGLIRAELYTEVEGRADKRQAERAKSYVEKHAPAESDFVLSKMKTKKKKGAQEPVVPNDPLFHKVLTKKEKKKEFNKKAKSLITLGSGMRIGGATLGAGGGSSDQGEDLKDQWGIKEAGYLPKSDPESAWNVFDGSKPNTLVAVIDSGLYMDHEDGPTYIWVNSGEKPGNGIDDDLNGYVDDVHGWNFLHENNDLTDRNGHGTFVSGIIAAKANNGVGIAGINPGAVIMPLKVANEDGETDSFNISRAIHYAVNHGAKVISLSLGSRGISDLEQMALNYAHSHGVFVVVAAGNVNENISEHGPASARRTFPVGSIDHDGNRSTISNWGANNGILAPGDSIYSIRSRDSFKKKKHSSDTMYYYRMSGTSFSTPMVAATASLLLAKNPELTNEQLEDILTRTADDMHDEGWDGMSGGGLLNATAALKGEAKTKVTAKINEVRQNKDSRKRFESLDVVVTVRGAFESFTIEAGKGKRPGRFKTVAGPFTKEADHDWVAQIGEDSLKGSDDWILRLNVKDNSGKETYASIPLEID